MEISCEGKWIPAGERNMLMTPAGTARWGARRHERWRGSNLTGTDAAACGWRDALTERERERAGAGERVEEALQAEG